MFTHVFRYIRFVRKDNQGLRTLLPKILIAIPFIFVSAMLLITAPFATNHLALTPISLINVLIVLVFAGVRLARWLTPRLNLRQWPSGAIALLFLLPSPSQVPENTFNPYSDSVWHQMSINASMMIKPAAWSASFDLNPDMGLVGYAPLVYRPLVEGSPITLTAVSGDQPGAYDLYAVSGFQVVPVTNSAQIWQTLSSQALPVHNFVLATNQPYTYPNETGRMIEMLAVNCQDCLNAYQVNINPEYLEKLALELGTFVVVNSPVGRALYLSEVLTIATASDYCIWGDYDAAAATLGGWGVTKLSNFALDPDSWVSRSVSKIYGNAFETMIDPTIQGIWNYQVFHGTVGVTTLDQMTYAWQAASVDTFTTSFFRFDYDFQTQGSIHFAQASSQDLSAKSIELPSLFEQNMQILYDPSTSNIPPITVRDSAHDLLDWNRGTPNMTPGYEGLDIRPIDPLFPGSTPTDIRPIAPIHPDPTFPNTTHQDISPFGVGPIDFEPDHFQLPHNNPMPSINIPDFTYSP